MTWPLGASNSCPFTASRIAVGVSSAGFLDRLLPQEDLEVGRFQRVVRHRLRILDEGAIALDERLVAVGVDGLEIRERRVAADRIFRTHRRDLDFRGDGGADRQLVVRQALVLVLAVERDDGVADDVRQHDVAARTP